MDTQQQKSWRVLLVGDHCEDVYHYGVCDRLSPEAPVPILRQEETTSKPGMSSNVKKNLQSLGVKVTHYHNNETIKKHRLIDSRYNQHLMRFDEGEVGLLAEFNLDKISNIKNVDAVVISDYNKGFLRSDTISQLCEKFKDTPMFVDTKKTDLSMFVGCTIKINEKEFSAIKRMPPEGDYIVTLGEGGALYKDVIYPTEKTEVFDVCGAGDVFLAALVYGYLKHGAMPKAVEIANKCASFSVSKMGTYVLTKEDLKSIL
ncbi:hypothetical protein CMI37_00830 [Candidatus Pacearchaeota archaeon]|nr:hypothetical protein [Candidatus Pacearchaeota archaeon]